MGKYCCFYCPSTDYSEKSIDDCCPTCGRAYGHPLKYPPRVIGDHKIVKSLDRGFYGAAYVAESGMFSSRVVIKISPKSFYDFFDKSSFQDECKKHHEISSVSNHVVKISNAFEATVQFDDEEKTELPCYVSVLAYLPGSSLSEYLSGTARLSIARAVQIAIDLLYIRSEFEVQHLNHNDLHSGNLIVEEMSSQTQRPNEIDRSMRVMAIDLGSLSEDTRSSGTRANDITFIGQHLSNLMELLLKNESELEERDYRVVLAMQRIAQSLMIRPQNSRQPNWTDLIEQIRRAYFRVNQHWRSWNEPLNLSGFGDHYNAQTLDVWHVPRLLVDPEGKWLSEVSKPGPQIITGMRGCGKTMLLKSLDLHARAALREPEDPNEALQRVAKDGFIGLFVSSQSLMDIRSQSLSSIESNLARLFLSYSLNAVRAIMHIASLSKDAVVQDAHLILYTCIMDTFGHAVTIPEPLALDDLEQSLTRLQVTYSTAKLTVDSGPRAELAPSTIFTGLAKALLNSIPQMSRGRVLFLLDDLSTRYLESTRISSLLSKLFFQNEICAFKFTSEWQTIELGLESPGENHPLREGRDVSIFDLGAEVHRTINSSGPNRGGEFVENILQQRGNVHSHHPSGMSPKAILGDISLEEIARDIVNSGSNSKSRKSVYRGLSALANVCVGDIGDVIKLYEDILARGSSKGIFPIPAEVQSQCFMDLSSKRLFDLNRRETAHKLHAISFAEAANELLKRSYQNAKDPKSARLRQHYSVYLKVTSGDEDGKDEQIKMLRELIDAGVFVFAGGVPRTKTRDSNPTRQFKLNYRKIYGLSSYIGLSDRDRFELSGRELEEWLKHPANGKEILIRNQTTSENEADDMPDDQETTAPSSRRVEFPTKEPVQTSLFTISELSERPATNVPAGVLPSPPPLPASILRIEPDSLKQIDIEAIVTGLGFEERALASNVLLSRVALPANVFAIRYREDGFSSEILENWSRNSNTAVHVVIDANGATQIPSVKGLVMVDISGLAKPMIFSTVLRELRDKKRVLICHASAEEYYPLHSDLAPLLDAESTNDPIETLDGLEQVITGERKPYRQIALLNNEYDSTRSRALLAFASAKHERLFSLLDRREYEYLQIIAPPGDEPRARVAKLAAKVMCNTNRNSSVREFDTSNLEELVRYLDGEFLSLFDLGGANLEIGLTGSKIQAVASAILCAKRRIAQVWYVKPKEFDPNRFSRGVGDIHFYDIRVE